MSFSLDLLLKAANAHLNDLWTARMSGDVNVLLPEAVDPGLVHTAEGRPSAKTRNTRNSLLAIGEQMRSVGISTSSTAIMSHASTTGRREELLALIGSAPWTQRSARRDRVEIHTRPAADGGTFVLAAQPAAPSIHAPHAMRALNQRLWHLPAGHPLADGSALPDEAPIDCNDDWRRSPSLTAAFLDIEAALKAEGSAMPSMVAEPATAPAEELRAAA